MINPIPKGWSYRSLNKPDYGFPYGDRINFVNNHYCELSRNLKAKGFMRFVGIILCLFPFILLLALFFKIVFSLYVNWFAVIVCIFGLVIGGGGGYHFFSFFIRGYFAPADCPIRFNRVTKKVYIYEDGLTPYTFCLLLPLKAFKLLGKESIKVYDWDDISGIQLSSSMLLSRGTTASNYHNMCLVSAPKTEEIKDSFMFAYFGGMNSEEWNWVCFYMKGNDNILSMEKRNRTHENTFMQLNKKSVDNQVVIGLDKASKAASLDELAEIEQTYHLTRNVYPVN